MTLLLLDTSGPVCGAAIVRDGRIAGEISCLSGRRHSVQAMRIVDELLENTGVARESVDAYAAVCGPGSFTGIRIGVAEIAAMAEAAGKPCAAVNALEALAAGAGAYEGLICPLIDARTPRVYTALFRARPDRPERLSEDRLTEIGDVIRELSGGRERVLFAGDGAYAHRAALREGLGNRALFAPEHLNGLRPGAACLLAAADAEAGGLLDPSRLRPVYLQPTQAERDLKKRTDA